MRDNIEDHIFKTKLLNIIAQSAGAVEYSERSDFHMVFKLPTTVLIVNLAEFTKKTLNKSEARGTPTYMMTGSKW